MTQQHLQIASAVIGFIGTLIMFFYGYSLKPTEGAVMGSPEVNQENQKIQKANRRIIKMQKFGILFLGASFVLQMFSFFF